MNRNGRLTGDNTDCEGLNRLICRVCPDIRGKKTLVLGTGGTSLTAVYTARQLGADPVLRVSRTAREGALTYEQAIREHRDARILINTTPCGMFPKDEAALVSIADFPAAEAVVDVVYHPLRTKLVTEARQRGIPAEGGMYMLVAQAREAAELFTGHAIPEERTDEIYGALREQALNLILIGMPGSGKSSIGRALAERMGREFVDCDAEIVLTTDNVNFTYRSSGPFPRLAPGNVEIGGTGWSRLAIERRCRYL